ncbi:hypothetical protein WJX81_002488 [Elliptochloris bilobata]|uniref:J domain-containing protein n=1 Tax=Elliptochloris bilobata TaxID=381761 RepID=A0AAW1SBM2_9CHLO
MKVDKRCLYEVLGVAKDASQADIKKAYRTLALRCHPDKCPGDENAKANFQSLQRIYAVLGNPKKRKVYDQTGSLADSEELAGEQFDALREYFRTLYKQVTVEDIEALEGEFRGSPEETAELLELHKRFHGDMGKVFEWLLFSDPRQDAHRFADAVRAAVADKRARDYKKFRTWAASVDARPRPKDPLAPRRSSAKEKNKGGGKTGAGDDAALIAQIRDRAAGAAGADGLLASLEARYCGKGARKGAPRGGEPPEEAFADVRARATTAAEPLAFKGAKPARKRAKI